MYRNGIKRLLAVVLSLCGMICLSWLFLILAVAIKLDSPGPVFFKQKRVGIGKKHFYILKFRTMRIDTPHDMPTHLLHDPDQYITRMGHFLRKTSLDELPQLWNIFVGDMAVIGPRPALWNQYDLLAERDKYHANDVRPGLTGWAQIHGRDELEIAEKAKLDGWYVEHLSFGLDVKCFFGTIAAVLKHDAWWRAAPVLCTMRKSDSFCRHAKASLLEKDFPRPGEDVAPVTKRGMGGIAQR